MVFQNISEDIELIEGEDWFADKIWTPNVFIENERDSTLMKTTRDSIFVRIMNNGMVYYHYRLKTIVLCDFKLRRFPHDIQNCSLQLESCKILFDTSLKLKYDIQGVCLIQKLL